MKILKLIPVVFFLIGSGCAMHLYAQATTGLDIMKKNENQLNVKDEQVELTMILVNNKGRERTRTVKQYIAWDEQDNRSAIVQFLSPADVKGTGLLSVENEDREDDQWLYLPALRKTRRISASSQTDNFIGSDFTFEDLRQEEVDQYHYTLLGDTVIDEMNCFHIEAVPNNDAKSKETGYSKREIYISKDNFIVTLIKFYNKEGEMSKIFKASEIKQVEGTAKYRPYHMVMENLKTNNKTILIFDNYLIDKGLEEDLFTQRYLEKSI